MDLSFRGTPKHMLVNHNGATLQFPFVVWNKVASDPVEEVYGPLNRYLATLPTAEHDRMFEVYRQIHGLLNSPITEKSLTAQVTVKVKELTKNFTWEHLRTWGINHSDVRVDKTMPASNATQNPDATTYLRDEVYELAIFSVLLRILVPVWGTYMELIKNEYGTLMKENTTLAIMHGSALWNFQPMVRLRQYVDAIATRRGSSMNTALSHGMPVSKLNSYLLGLAVIRRLAIFKPCGSIKGEVPLVAFIYRFLEDKLGNLAKSNFRDKFQASGDGEEADSIADQFRIPAQVPAYIPVIANCFLSNIAWCGQSLGFTPEMLVTAQAIYDKISTHEHFVINDVHLPIVALCIKSLASPRDMRYINRQAYLSAIALTATQVRQDGYNDIFQLMLAIQQPKDIRTMAMLPQNGQHCRELTEDLATQLRAEYPALREDWIAEKTCPGMILINKIVSCISEYNWIGLEDYSNIRTSLANMIINRKDKM